MEKKKKLGLPSVIATGVGVIIATSCLLSLGQGAGTIGTPFILSMASGLRAELFCSLFYVRTECSDAGSYRRTGPVYSGLCRTFSDNSYHDRRLSYRKYYGCQCGMCDVWKYDTDDFFLNRRCHQQYIV